MKTTLAFRSIDLNAPTIHSFRKFFAIGKSFLSDPTPLDIAKRRRFHVCRATPSHLAIWKNSSIELINRHYRDSTAQL